MHIIHPLGLVLVDKVIYVVATYWDFKDVRQLALHRIHRAGLLEERAKTPEGFSLQEYVDSGEFRYVLHRKKIRLKMVMGAGRAAHLSETRLAEDQRLGKSADGRVTVEATVQDTLQLRFWLKGMGADLEVVAPAWLRRTFQAEARAVAALYGKD